MFEIYKCIKYGIMYHIGLKFDYKQFFIDSIEVY